LLTGKYDNGIPPGSRLSEIEFLKDSLYQGDKLERVRAFGSYAQKLGVSRAQLALAWAAHHPQVSSVILGATKLSQLVENLGALDIPLTQAQLAEIDQIF